MKENFLSYSVLQISNPEEQSILVQQELQNERSNLCSTDVLMMYFQPFGVSLVSVVNLVCKACMGGCLIP